MPHHQSPARPLLAIDTSGPWLQVGLTTSADAAPIVFAEKIGTGHAERLFSAIDEVCAKAGVTLRELSRVATTTGPGSFTGLRIGIAAARGFGLALGCPVIGVPNLLALSLAAPRFPCTIRVDARRDQVYVQDFDAAGRPANQAELRATEPDAHLTDPRVSMDRLLDFAAAVEPSAFPPAPFYLRAADAKPQTKNLIAPAAPRTPSGERGQ